MFFLFCRWILVFFVSLKFHSFSLFSLETHKAFHLLKAFLEKFLFATFALWASNISCKMISIYLTFICLLFIINIRFPIQIYSDIRKVAAQFTWSTFLFCFIFHKSGSKMILTLIQWKYLFTISNQLVDYIVSLNFLNMLILFPWHSLCTLYVGFE